MEEKPHDPRIVGWRAYYTDNREFNSQDHTWEELPEHGVLYIVLYQRTRPYRRMCSGRSIYWKEETIRGPVYAYDDAADAIISDIAHKKGWVKYGKWVTDEEMAEVIKKATASIEAPNESLRIDKK